MNKVVLSITILTSIAFLGYAQRHKDKKGSLQTDVYQYLKNKEYKSFDSDSLCWYKLHYYEIDFLVRTNENIFIQNSYIVLKNESLSKREEFKSLRELDSFIDTNTYWESESKFVWEKDTLFLTDTAKGFSPSGEINVLRIYNNGVLNYSQTHNMDHTLTILIRNHRKFKFLKFDPDSCMITKTYLKDYIFFGKYYEYLCNENGASTIITKGKHNHGRVGKWEHYYNNGAIESKGRYLPIIYCYDTVKIVYENSKLPEFFTEHTYEVKPIWTKTGWWRYYDINGIIERKEYFQNGNMMKIVNK